MKAFRPEADSICSGRAGLRLFRALVFALAGFHLFASSARIVTTISGTVRDTNGQPVAGVLVQSDPAAFADSTTDTNGNYTIEVYADFGGFTGTLAASLGNFMFVPGSLSYTNVTTPQTDQDFLVVPTIAPVLSLGATGTNLVLEWGGISGVSYQAFWSTNLSTWQSLGELLPGTNGLMYMSVPLLPQPVQYFRVGARD